MSEDFWKEMYFVLSREMQHYISLGLLDFF